MTLRLEDTTAAEVASEIRKERHRLGAAGTGMVMTLIIIADEENQNDAEPCRVLLPPVNTLPHPHGHPSTGSWRIPVGCGHQRGRERWSR